MPPRIRWQRARLADSRLETRRARTLVFDVPKWAGHDAGQHVDVKLTGEDGFTAQRSYSIASASVPGRLELTVQAVSDGVVSPYLVDTMQLGDELELRGPVGGWFRWTDQLAGPVLLVGGGSGIAPLMAMLRQRLLTGSAAPFHLVYSARTPDHVFYANELHAITQGERDIDVDLLYTRSGLPGETRSPGLPGETRSPGRLARNDLPGAAPGDQPTRVYVCGPNGFVENAARLLVDLGHQPASIRTERFGSSGG